MRTFVLASASPRRSAILSQLKIPFRVEPSDFDETADGLEAEDRPQKFAEGKALDVSRKFPQEHALAFDTPPCLDRTPLGQPKA
uniref:Maf family protein n=1 Tax=uncultured Fibrobacter sp. TaxID=261512 RepID=UPI0025935CC0